MTRKNNPPLLAPFATDAARSFLGTAFGKSEWEKYFGDVGIEPTLPNNIDKILKSPCPYWSDRRVEETHLLVLIPEKVDGKPLSLNLLGQLIKNPLPGGYPTRYEYCNPYAVAQLGDVKVKSSYWALVSRHVVPNSLGKSLVEQKKLLKPSYGVSKCIELATSILAHYVRSGERLYSNKPSIFGRCEEKGKASFVRFPMAVGGFAPTGLQLYLGDPAVGVQGLSVSRIL